MKTALSRSIDRGSRHADRLMGNKAKHYHNPKWTVNVATGEQVLITQPKNVIVRSWPIKHDEIPNLSEAGLTDVTTRWVMRAKYGECSSSDLFKEGPFTYQVVPNGVLLDEFGVDYILYLSRR